MARVNKAKKAVPIYTHEGAKAVRVNPEQQLSRVVLANLLWENQFYIEGEEAAKIIVECAEAVSPAYLAKLAIQARSIYNLRHVPLLLAAVLCRRAAGTSLPSLTLEKVIQRADELAEFLAIYAQLNGVTPDKLKPKLSHQVRKGLAKAFTKFDAYQLGKYNRDNAIKLRDVLFLVHPKPVDEVMAATWKKLVEGTLESPDTWEVGLSAGKDKKETFTRLLVDGKLGYLALLRNLRNMTEAGVSKTLLSTALLDAKGAQNVLPFRYIAAARACPQMEPAIDKALMARLATLAKLPGLTLIVVDVSGSMQSTLSAKSQMSRLDAAAALASVIAGQCEYAQLFATAGDDGSRIHQTVELPPRTGIAGADVIATQLHRLGGGGIFLTPCLRFIRDKVPGVVDRLIVITDEQDCAISDKDKPSLADPFATHNYMMNVGADKNGIGYGKWLHIDGFSDQSVRFIREYEGGFNQEVQ